MGIERETVATSVGGKLDWLRDSAMAHPEGAADSAWAWIKDLSSKAKSDPKGADADLNALFHMGTPPTTELDGPTDGILVTVTPSQLGDTVARTFFALHAPWKGKVFYPKTSTGINLMTTPFSLVAKLPWPFYSMKDRPGGKLAFDFKTFVEPGVDDPDIDVFVIDYKDVASNPKLLVRSVRDELVELVPGVFLGKIMVKTKSGYTKLGFFALRNPR